MMSCGARTRVCVCNLCMCAFKHLRMCVSGMCRCKWASKVARMQKNKCTHMHYIHRTALHKNVQYRHTYKQARTHCINTRMRVHIHAYLHKRIQTHTHAHMHHKHTCVHKRMHACIHIHHCINTMHALRAYLHAYIHACMTYIHTSHTPRVYIHTPYATHAPISYMTL